MDLQTDRKGRRGGREDKQTDGEREGKTKGGSEEWEDRWTNGGIEEERKGKEKAFKRCILVLLIQVSEVLSQDILLSTEGPGQTSIPHIVGDIKEVSM